MAVAERSAPNRAEAIGELIAQCDRDGLKIAVVGGDTLAAMGSPLERCDVRLVTTKLSAIVGYEPADLTIAAQAGVPIQAIATLLATHRQFIPFDAPKPQHATLGGTLAAGWLGPRRHVHGRLRDYVLGSTIVLADGTIASAGGIVVKNVAGYDMSRLYVGSFGTLGVLVQANLKTLVMPRQSRVFLAALPERTRSRALDHIATLNVPPAAAFWIEGFQKIVDGEDGPQGRLLLLLEGSDALLERATRDVRASLGGAGVPETRIVDAGARESFQRIVDAYIAPLGERSITYRVYSVPDEAETRAMALAELARRCELRAESIVDVMNGDIVFRASRLDARSFGAKVGGFDDAVHEIEPHAQIVACNHPHRNELQAWGEPPASIDRMRALKACFDPNRTLNPGRFVGGI